MVSYTVVLRDCALLGNVSYQSHNPSLISFLSEEFGLQDSFMYVQLHRAAEEHWVELKRHQPISLDTSIFWPVNWKRSYWYQRIFRRTWVDCWAEDAGLCLKALEMETESGNLRMMLYSFAISDWEPVLASSAVLQTLLPQIKHQLWKFRVEVLA